MSRKPVGFRVYKGSSDNPSEEYLGYVPNDGQPGDTVQRALKQYNDLGQQVDEAVGVTDTDTKDKQ